MDRSIAPSTAPAVPYAAFAAFGTFWGTWGAALPTMRAQASATDAELGAALLFVGAGAVPAMLLTGRLLDRVGSRLSAVLLGALAVAGLLLSLVAHDAVTLAIAMALVGAASGAADVCINAVAADAEHARDRPVLARSHGLFSAAVVLSSIATGAVLSASAPGPSLIVAFAVAGIVVLGAALTVWRGTAFGAHRSEPGDPEGRALSGRGRVASLLPLVAVGSVGAIAFAIENAYQSWGAVFLADRFASSAAVASWAPATFAAVAALARLSLAPLSRSSPATLLVAGGLTAAAGSVLVVASASVPVALAGMALAALGTATLYPTLISQAVRRIPQSRKGAATSTVAATAYLGFLLGPAAFGLLAGATDLRGAFLGVAAVALVFAVVSWPVSGWSSRRGSSLPSAVGARDRPRRAPARPGGPRTRTSGREGA